MARFTALVAFLIAPSLRAEPVDPEWRQQLAKERERRLTDLEAYIKAGNFPHNHDFEDGRVPYLIDRHGRLCAVAYLFSMSQVEDFSYATFIRVSQVAVESPNVNARDLTGLGDEDWARRMRMMDNYSRAFARAEGPAREVQARFEKEYHESEDRMVEQWREFVAQAREQRKPEDHIRNLEEQLRSAEVRRAAGDDARLAVAVIRECGRHRAWYQRLPSLVGEDNHVRLKDLEAGPLWDWILASGLTREECAMIQPSYSYLLVSCDHCLPGSEPGRSKMEGSDYYALLRKEQERVRTHLGEVLRKLRETSDDSLDLATRRLQQARPTSAPSGENPSRAGL